ncbi:acyl-CoA dehydrogenase family protein [Phenylobacterium sp.]|uniref:acyl-CoA dehydrogenase family protein n=1 Tax=Phenylobacterium sp. TaxID=1871053 RepID=UPI003BABC791
MFPPLSAELTALRDKVRLFMREHILPEDRRLDPDATEFDATVYARLADAARRDGLWALWAPKRFGGQELGPFAQVVVIEEMCGHRNGLYNPGYGVFGRYPADIAYQCSAEQAERFVTPAVRDGAKTFFAMSEPPPDDHVHPNDPVGEIHTRAVRRGDHWVINGRKTWISNGLDAEWGLVFARTETPGREGVSCFFVERGKYQTAPIPLIRADYPAELRFTDCAVPAENLLGLEGRADAMVHDIFARSRLSFSASHIGAAQAALTLAVAKCRRGKSVLEATLADSLLEIQAARAILWDAAWKAEKGLDFHTEAAAAKLYSSEALCRIIDRSMQIYGGEGITKKLPFERWYREARGRLVSAGNSETIREEIARTLVLAV